MSIRFAVTLIAAFVVVSAAGPAGAALLEP